MASEKFVPVNPLPVLEMLDKPRAFVLLEKFLQPSEASVMPISPGIQYQGEEEEKQEEEEEEEEEEKEENKI